MIHALYYTEFISMVHDMCMDSFEIMHCYINLYVLAFVHKTQTDITRSFILNIAGRELVHIFILKIHEEIKYKPVLYAM